MTDLNTLWATLVANPDMVFGGAIAVAAVLLVLFGNRRRRPHDDAFLMHPGGGDGPGCGD